MRRKVAPTQCSCLLTLFEQVSVLLVPFVLLFPLCHTCSALLSLCIAICRRASPSFPDRFISLHPIRRHIPMLLITFSDVSKDFGGNPVFSEIGLELLEGERIGLVGENGSGKSTLFKLIADIESPSAGVISRRRNLTIGYLTQEIDPAMHEQNIFEAVAETSPELAALPAQLSALEAQME